MMDGVVGIFYVELGIQHLQLGHDLPDGAVIKMAELPVFLQIAQLFFNDFKFGKPVHYPKIRLIPVPFVFIYKSYHTFRAMYTHIPYNRKPAG
jgi:hypothetical protein